MIFIRFSVLKRDPAASSDVELEDEELPEDPLELLEPCFFFFFLRPRRRAFFSTFALTFGLGSKAVPEKSAPGSFCPGPPSSTSLDGWYLLRALSTSAPFTFCSFLDFSFFFFFLLGDSSSPLALPSGWASALRRKACSSSSWAASSLASPPAFSRFVNQGSFSFETSSNSLPCTKVSSVTFAAHSGLQTWTSTLLDSLPLSTRSSPSSLVPVARH